MSSIRDMMKKFDKPGEPVLPLSPSGKPLSRSPKMKTKQEDQQPPSSENVPMKLIDKIRYFDSGSKSRIDTAASSTVVNDGTVKRAAASFSAKEQPASPRKNSIPDSKQPREKSTTPSVFSITGFVPASPKGSKPASPDTSAATKRSKGTPITSPSNGGTKKVSSIAPASPVVDVPAPAPVPIMKEAPAPGPVEKEAPAPEAKEAAPAAVPANIATEQAKEANAGNGLDHSATLDKPDFPKPPLFTDNN